MGWAAYVHFHPMPLLQDRWAALVRESALRAGPGQAGKRGDREAAGWRFGTTAAGGGMASGRVVFSMTELLAMSDPIGQGAALLEALKTADSATCEKWLREVEGLSHPDLRQSAVLAIMERWTEIDPVGALAGAGDDRRRKSMVLRQWAHLDPVAALAAAGGDFDDAIQQGMMETDPDHAFSRWQEIAPGKPFPITRLEFALRSQVQRDPETAMRQVPDDNESQTNGIRGEMFSVFMDRDPESALKFAGSSSDVRVRQQLLTAFAERFPARAEPLLDTLWGPEKSAIAVVAARARAKEDPEAAARWLRTQVPAEEFEGALRQFTLSQGGMSAGQLSGILKLCPDAAAGEKLLWDVAESPASGSAVKQLLLESREAGSLSAARQLLAFKVLPAAQATALTGGAPGFSPDEGAGMLKQLTRTWNPGNATEVAAAISAMPESMQSSAAGSFVSQTGFVDPNLGGYPRGAKLTAENTAAIFSALTPEAQARTALNFAWKQLEDPARAAGTLALSSVSMDDPAAAAVYEKVAGNWTVTDPLAASEWIRNLPPGAARDAAALTLIESQAASDPAAAGAWAGTLRDPVAVLRARQLLNSTAASP